MLPAGSPLPDWLTWLETLSPTEIDLGLDRVNAVLERLSLHVPDQVLLVAGTNGKGSSVAMIDALLGAAGYRVGAYTSPHLIRYNERIAVEGVPVADEQIVAAFERIEAVRNAVPLTYFEYGTLAAMDIFSRLGVDVWVLEIGLGITSELDPPTLSRRPVISSAGAPVTGKLVIGGGSNVRRAWSRNARSSSRLAAEAGCPAPRWRR